VSEKLSREQLACGSQTFIATSLFDPFNVGSSYYVKADFDDKHWIVSCFGIQQWQVANQTRNTNTASREAR
jgi:hypothetical protein